MTLSYSLRLIYFSLACFGLVNLAVTLVLRRLSNRMIQHAGKMQSSRASSFLIALRLCPAALGLLAVAVFCVPSYLWLEPDIASEDASVVGLTAAILGFSMWGVAFARALRAALRSARFSQDCKQIGAERNGIITVPNAGRLIALVGIFRPRLIVSSEVIDALDAGQLAVALRHERMHQASRDNLKRLLILLSPALFLSDLERAWKRFAEWSADDLAAAGDTVRSAELASALVRVARIRPTAAPALATSLLEESDGLRVRVDRLLEPAPALLQSSSWKWPIVVVLAALGFVSPTALAFVHQVLERLVH